MLIKSMLNNMKISKKLMISYLFACVIPLLLTSIIIYRASAKNLEDTALELASIFSSQIVADMDELISEYDRITKSVLVDNDVIVHLSEGKKSTIVDQMNEQLYMRKIMMRLMTLKPEIKTICLLTDDRQLFQFSSEGDLIDYDMLIRQPWLKEIREWKENTALTAVHDCSYYDRNREGIVFTVGRKLRNQNGAYMGMILFDLDPACLITLSEGFLLARNQYNIKISITNSENGVLYDSDVASGRINWSEAMEKDILLYQKNPEDYIVLGSKTEKAGLNVNIVVPRSDLLFKINRIEYMTVVSVFFCVLVVVEISLILSRTITSSLRNLQSRMKQMEEGDYRILEKGTSNDEIGDLIQSYNHMVIRIKTLIEQVYLGEIKQKNAKYLALQTQINPHMLYNTLETIRMKALRSGATEVADMVKLLARMFRVVLSKPSSAHKIRDEIEHAQVYIRMQNLRFRDMFFLQVEIEEEIQDSGIIPMVLQPIIENSIEHGFGGWNHPLHIKLSGRIVENGDIMLYVCDDGKGITQERMAEVNRKMEERISFELLPEGEKEEKETSIGLCNISERIKLQYGDSYYLRLFECQEGGAGVEMRIPQRKAEQDRVRQQSYSEENSGEAQERGEKP